MPLLIEDGSGVAGADSWVTEAEATTYWSDRQVTDWTDALPAVREAKLREAADYLMLAYRWPGQPSTIVQRLPWPRSGVRSGSSLYPTNAIPTQVIDAQKVLAVEALSTPLLLRAPAPDRQLIEETKSAKGFSKTLKYATSPVDAVSGLSRFPAVDALLAGIAQQGTGSSFRSIPLRKAFR